VTIFEFKNADEKRIFQHVIEATPIKEMEGWLQAFIKKQVFDDQ
jgi:hypothetical protein